MIRYDLAGRAALVTGGATGIGFAGWTMLGQTDDIAGVIVFLGFGADMVTGQTVVVDGGLTL